MKTFLSGIAVALIAVIAAFYLNHKSPDIRYQLSSPVPIAAAEGQPPMNVQQLEVANLGTAISQKIQVQLRKPAAQVNVLKDSMSDSYSQYTTANGVEVVYDALAPAHAFKVILTLAGSTLEPQDVLIRDQEGVANPILSTEHIIAYRMHPSPFAVGRVVLLEFLTMAGDRSPPPHSAVASKSDT